VPEDTTFTLLPQSILDESFSAKSNPRQKDHPDMGEGKKKEKQDP
jgi:hypothetical protein